MPEQPVSGALDRFESDLRAALRDEAASLPVALDATVVRQRIGRRRRERRMTGGFLAAAAAVLAVVIGAQALPGLLRNDAAMTSPTPVAGPEAVTVRPDPGAESLVVEAVPVSGEVRPIAHIANPFDEVDLSGERGDWRARYSPDGYLAIAVPAPDDASGIVLVFDLGDPRREPLRVYVAGTPGFAWGPGARLLVTPSFSAPERSDPVLVDARAWSATRVPLPADVLPVLLNGPWPPEPRWTPDGKVVGAKRSRADFSSTVVTLDLGPDGATVHEGLPTVLRISTGLEVFAEPEASGPAFGQIEGRSVIWTVTETAMNRESATTWYVAPSGSLLVGRPVAAPDGSGVLFLRYDEGGRLALLHVATPGAAATALPLPWRGAEQTTSVAGIAGDGSVLAISADTALGLAGRNGAVRSLPAGSRFAGWAASADVPVRGTTVSCGGALPPAGLKDLTVVAPSAAGQTSAALTVVPAGGSEPSAASWHAETAESGDLLVVAAQANLAIALPPGTCASSWIVKAASPASIADDPATDGLALVIAPAGWSHAGLLPFTGPAQGDWVLRATLFVRDASGGPDTMVVAVLRVRATSGPVATAGPPASPGGVSLGAPSISAVDGQVHLWWLYGEGPAQGPTVHLGSPALMAGDVTAKIACRGSGELRLGLATVPDDTASGSPMAGAPPRDGASVRCSSEAFGTREAIVTLKALGGENALVVERLPAGGGAPPAWAAAIAQGVDVRCLVPTPALVAAVTVPADSGRPQPLRLVGYSLTGANRPTPELTSGDVLALPPIAGAGDADWRVILPEGLCAAGVLIRGLDGSGFDGSSSGDEGDPQIGEARLPRPDAGESAALLSVQFVGPDGKRSVADFALHAVVGDLPNASSMPAP